jgi:predicted permease
MFLQFFLNFFFSPYVFTILKTIKKNTKNCISKLAKLMPPIYYLFIGFDATVNEGYNPVPSCFPYEELHLLKVDNLHGSFHHS